MIRKIITLITASALAVSALGFAACKNKNDERFSYTEIMSGDKVTAYVITGLYDKEVNEITVPAKYNRKPVTAIAENAFAGCESLTSVVIPDSVQSIGGKAFYECSGLETITFGKGLKEVGAIAFGRCDELKSVYVGSVGDWCGIDFIDLGANPMYFASELYFGGSPAGNTVIPDNVTQIKPYTFYGCENITALEIGSGVTEIGEMAFYNCTNLKSVAGGKNLLKIGKDAFLDCSSLESAEIGEKVQKIEENAFCRCTMLKEIVIPASVQSIGECAFNSCTSLKSVTFNDGLKQIGDCAFGSCSSLERFEMPDSVTKIGWGVLMFGGITAGFGGSADPSNSVKHIVISNSITEISDYAFNNCNITDVVLGDSVQTIGYSAFYGCAMLESVVVPESVTKITSYAFYRCSMLTTVYYKGNEAGWSAISIGKNGNDILNATIYYYSETKPAAGGNFWHYVNGEAVKW